MPLLPCDLYQKFLTRIQNNKSEFIAYYNGSVDYEKITYAELYTQLNIISPWLERITVAGDRIVFFSENSIEFILAMLVCAKLNLILVPLDNTMEKMALLQHLSDLKPALIFASKDKKSQLTIQEHYTIQTMDFFQKPYPLERRTPAKQSQTLILDESIATIIFTSGTTSSPKAVMLSADNILHIHYSIAYSFKNMMKQYYPNQKISEQNNICCLMPNFHVAGLCMNLWDPILNACSIGIVNQIHPSVMRQMFTELKPRVLPSVPEFFNMFKLMLEQRIATSKPAVRGIFFIAKKLAKITHLLPGKYQMRVRKRIFSSIHASFGGDTKLFFSGGAALYKKTKLFYQDLGFPVLEAWGMTETSGIALAGLSSTSEYCTVLPNNSVKIKPLDNSGVGELLIKGAGTVTGYLNDPETTRVKFEDGWLKTGDLAHMREGKVKILGRADNVIVTNNGKKFMPTHIEQHYAMLPHVKAYHVIPLRQDAKLIITAVALLDEAAQQLSLNDVQQQLTQATRRAHRLLDTSARIQQFIIVETLPYTSTLKLKRQVIIKQLTDNSVHIIKKFLI